MNRLTKYSNSNPVLTKQWVIIRKFFVINIPSHKIDTTRCTLGKTLYRIILVQLQAIAPWAIFYGMNALLVRRVLSSRVESEQGIAELSRLPILQLKHHQPNAKG